MKANFWQILGAILVVIGAVGYIYVNHIKPADKKQNDGVVAPASAPVPATAPTTAPLP